MINREECQKFCDEVIDKMKQGEGRIYLQCNNCNFKFGWFASHIRRLFINYKRGCPMCKGSYTIIKI
jgi:hypothetical protein